MSSGRAASADPGRTGAASEESRHTIEVAQAQQRKTSAEPSIRYNLAWQTASNLGVGAAGGVYLLYLGRVLGAEKFGLYALTTAIATFAFAATDLRVHEATVKWAADWQRKPVEAARAICSLLAVDSVGRALVLLVLVLCAPIFGRLLLHDSHRTSLILIAGVGACLAKMGNNSAMGTLRALGRFDWQGGILISSWLLKLLLTASLLTLLHLDLTWILVLYYGCDVLGNFAAIATAGRELRKKRIIERDTLRPFPPLTRELKRFLLNGTGISLSDSLLRELDTAIVGSLLPLEAVGVYRMAKNIVTLIWRGLDPIAAVLMPEFSRLAAVAQYPRILAIGRRATLFLFVIVALALIAGAALLPVAVPWVLGAGFAGVSKVAIIMLAGLLFGAPLLWVYALWVAAGRLGMQLLANATSALMACVLFLLLTPRYGLNGAATSFAVAISMPFILSFCLWRVWGEKAEKAEKAEK